MKTTFIKTLLLYLSFAVASASSQAQSIYLNFFDGSESSYSLADIRKITFEVDDMNLMLWDGTVYTWNINNISHYEYDANPLELENLLNKVNSWQVCIYPNPVDKLLYVHYSLPSDDKITIELSDMQGKRVLETKIGKQLKGEHQESIDLSTLQPGQYICRISGKNNMISKHIIKQ
jgi:hypothetical protein